VINAYLTDTTVQKQYKGEDQWNEPAARISVTRRCRVDYRTDRILDATGQVVICRARILLAPLAVTRANHSARAAATVAFEDLFTVDSVDYPVLQIRQAKDFSTRITEVWV